MEDPPLGSTTCMEIIKRFQHSKAKTTLGDISLWDSGETQAYMNWNIPECPPQLLVENKALLSLLEGNVLVVKNKKDIRGRGSKSGI